MRMRPKKLKTRKRTNPDVRLRVRFANATKWIAPYSDWCEYENKSDDLTLNFTIQTGFPKEKRSEGVRNRMDIRLRGSTKIAYRMSRLLYLIFYL